MPFSTTPRHRVYCSILLSLAGCKAVDSNTPPVADAGPDQLSYVHSELQPDGTFMDVFDPVTLDGSASSDPDGPGVARYYWAFDTIPIGSQLEHAALEPNAANTPQTSFTPDREGIFGVMLEVFDGQRVSVKDYVQVEVVRENAAPLADAGPDINGLVGSSAVFDGSASADPDGDYLSFQWQLEVVPPDSLLTSADIVYPATSSPRLVPDVEGVYTLSLVAFDGTIDSAPDFVTLTAVTGNQPPVVDAGSSFTATPCYENPILLDGSGSFDPEGDPFTYEWGVLEAPYGSLVSGSSLSTPGASSTRVQLDLHGLYVFTLTLDDGQSSPSTGTVAVLYDDGSTEEPPAADAGGNLTVRGDTTCTSSGCPPCLLTQLIDGSDSSDPNGDPLSYAWSVVSGDASFSDASSPVATLTGPALTPSAAGRTVTVNVGIQLVVADCVSSSTPSTATITFTCEGI